MPKRKSNESPDVELCLPICIIHDSAVTNPGNITLIKNVTDPNRRFQELVSKRDRRYLTSLSSSQRKESACQLIPEQLEDHHGYHRDCYKRFTNHLDKLPQVSDDPADPGEGTSYSMRKSLRGHESDLVLFSKDCIFCNKTERIRIKIGASWTWQPTSKFEFGGGATVIEIAKSKQDDQLLTRIRGEDLFAREAHYHPACRKKYTYQLHLWNSRDSVNISTQAQLEEAHNSAFHCITNFIEEHVIAQNKVVPLSHLRLMYTKELQKTPFPNPDYRSEKLKQRLLKSPNLVSKLQFTSIKDKNLAFYIVYNTNIKTGDAIGKT